MVLKPSEAAYTAAASPAGPAPTMTTSKTCRSGSMVSPDASTISVSEGSTYTCPLSNITTGSRLDLSPN